MDDTTLYGWYLHTSMTCAVGCHISHTVHIYGLTYQDLQLQTVFHYTIAHEHSPDEDCKGKLAQTFVWNLPKAKLLK